MVSIADRVLADAALEWLHKVMIIAETTGKEHRLSKGNYAIRLVRRSVRSKLAQELLEICQQNVRYFFRDEMPTGNGPASNVRSPLLPGIEHII